MVSDAWKMLPCIICICKSSYSILHAFARRQKNLFAFVRCALPGRRRFRCCSMKAPSSARSVRISSLLFAGSAYGKTSTAVKLPSAAPYACISSWRRKGRKDGICNALFVLSGWWRLDVCLPAWPAERERHRHDAAPRDTSSAVPLLAATAIILPPNRLWCRWARQHYWHAVSLLVGGALFIWT